MANHKLSFDFDDFDFNNPSDEDTELEDERTRNEDMVKKIFNDQMKMEPYYKSQVDDFLNSTSSAEAVVVILNFSAIGESERKSQLIPGEMALSAFSLNSGIVDNCSVYIHHGRNISEKALECLHNLLDLPSTTPAKYNYETTIWTLNMFRKKYQCGKGINQLAHLFCRKSEYDRVTSCLDFLLQAGGGDQFGFQVIPLEYLVARIVSDIHFKNAGQNKGPLSDKEAVGILDSGNYRKNRLACPRHSESKKGLYYCPLRIVNQHACKIIGALTDTKMTSHDAFTVQNWDDESQVFKRKSQLEAWKTVISLRRVSVPIPENLERKEVKVVSNSSDVEKPAKKDCTSVLDPVPAKKDLQPVPYPATNPCVWNSQFYPSVPQYHNPTSVYNGWNNPYMMPLAFAHPFYFHQPTQWPLLHQWPTMGNCHCYPQVQFPNPHYPMMNYEVNNFGQAQMPAVQVQMGQSPMPMDYYSPSQRMIQYGNYNHPHVPFPSLALPPQREDRFNGSESTGVTSLPENNDVSKVQSSSVGRPLIPPANTNTTSQMENFRWPIPPPDLTSISNSNNPRANPSKPHVGGRPG